MIFLDTSALYALADRADHNHLQAKALFEKALRDGEVFLVHNYVIVETVALIHHRLGFISSKKFLHDTTAFEIVWIDTFLHEMGMKSFLQHGKRKLSFVDCISFTAMRQKGIQTAFAFDEDFVKAGFKFYS